MALFEFELDPVEKIRPWGTPEEPSLSWFALTLGKFWMPVGDQVLFRYRAALRQELQVDSRGYVDYQLASIARDILGSVAPGIAPLPPFIENLAANRELLDRLISIEPNDDSEAALDLSYAAGRWLGERSPWTSYFVACPRFHFLRIRDRMHIRWDNRQTLIDGAAAWDAPHGSYELSVDEFLRECRDFANRLLSKMNERILEIEAGTSRPQIPQRPEALREQHAEWAKEFDEYFREHSPDIPWGQTEHAIRQIAATHDLPLPGKAG